ncbi:response regulator [Amycolatopsis mediterranei]|uniref:response regulator n=1 Tax=Amycolatopsis mediterranei TaxID=33910 RepID=UPI0034419420
MQVLIIEDDERIAQPLREGLGRYGFTTDHAPTGAAALSAAPADMILLNLGLPDSDGIDLCQRLRRTGDSEVRTQAQSRLRPARPGVTSVRGDRVRTDGCEKPHSPDRRNVGIGYPRSVPRPFGTAQ